MNKEDALAIVKSCEWSKSPGLDKISAMDIPAVHNEALVKRDLTGALNILGVTSRRGAAEGGGFAPACFYIYVEGKENLKKLADLGLPFTGSSEYLGEEKQKQV